MKRLFTFALCAGCLLLPAAAEARYRELAAQAPAVSPSCPAEPCQAIGRVTGYMGRIGDLKNPYRIPHTGKITAWTVQLAKPDENQVQFFTDLYGGPSQARISIVRPGKKSKRLGTSYRLLAQSPVQRLDSYFGSTPTFALDDPLTVKPGNFVALTVRTWAPVLALGLGRDNYWFSSRRKGDCDNVSQRAATESVGGLRYYGCTYRTARLTYSATFVPQPRPTNRAGN
jgi:hypothetical protein